MHILIRDKQFMEVLVFVNPKDFSIGICQAGFENHNRQPSREDITEFKEKQRLAAASETIGATCHELNQPLQAIMGNVELLSNSQLEEGAVARIEKIYSEMEQIKTINIKLMNVTNYQTKLYLSSKILDIEKSTSQ
jgi:signal transduction histidine kinase